MLAEDDVAEVADDSDVSDVSANDDTVVISDDTPVSELFTAVLQEDRDNRLMPNSTITDLFMNILGCLRYLI